MSGDSLYFNPSDFTDPWYLIVAFVVALLLGVRAIWKHSLRTSIALIATGVVGLAVTFWLDLALYQIRLETPYVSVATLYADEHAYARYCQWAAAGMMVITAVLGVYTALRISTQGLSKGAYLPLMTGLAIYLLVYVLTEYTYVAGNIWSPFGKRIVLVVAAAFMAMWFGNAVRNWLKRLPKRSSLATR